VDKKGNFEDSNKSSNNEGGDSSKNVTLTNKNFHNKLEMKDVQCFYYHKLDHYA